MKPYGRKYTRTHYRDGKHPDGCICKPRYVNKGGHRKDVKMKLLAIKKKTQTEE